MSIPPVSSTQSSSSDSSMPSPLPPSRPVRLLKTTYDLTNLVTLAVNPSLASPTLLPLPSLTPAPAPVPTRVLPLPSMKGFKDAPPPRIALVAPDMSGFDPPPKKVYEAGVRLLASPEKRLLPLEDIRAKNKEACYQGCLEAFLETPAETAEDQATQKFIQRWQSITKSHVFLHKEHPFKVTALEGKAGQFNQLYAVQGPIQLIEGIENEQIVLRVFKSIDTGAEARSMLEEQRKNYLEIRLAGLPTALILNFDTMMSDGFVAVPFLEHPFNFEGLEQTPPIQQFLKICYAYDINADAHHGTKAHEYKDSNFRSETLNGPPVICDWMEQEEDGDIRFSSRLAQVILPSWTKGETTHPLLNSLDPRILRVNWGEVPETLSVANVRKLFESINELKNNYLASVKTSADIEPLPAKFSQGVMHCKKEWGLESIPTETLKALLRVKDCLGFERPIPASEFPAQEIFDVKIRGADNKVLSIKTYLLDKYKTYENIYANRTAIKEELIELISAGNPVIKRFLIET